MVIDWTKYLPYLTGFVLNMTGFVLNINECCSIYDCISPKYDWFGP